MTDSISLKIKAQYHDLSAKEKKIADYILAHPDHMIDSTISDLAKKIEIADSTLFQFTRKLGYKGFKDFKISFLTQDKKDIGIPAKQEITSQDDELSITKKVFHSNIASASDTLALLDEKELSRTMELLNSAQRIFFFGSESSQLAAQAGYQKFLSLGLDAFYDSDFHLQMVQASRIRSNDCILCLSVSGHCRRLASIAQSAHEQGASVIVITSNAGSVLARTADVCLISPCEQMACCEDSSCFVAQYCILDALFVCYAVGHPEAWNTCRQRTSLLESQAKE